MLIIIPVRRRVYSCPRCKSRLRFFSWIPILKPEWTCRRCGQKFQINAICLATNWAYGFALWSMPIAFILTEFFLIIVAVVQFAVTQTPLLAFLKKWAIGLPLMGVLTALLAALVSFFLGFFVGLMYGMIAVHRRGSKPERPRRRRKKRPADGDSSL